MEKYVMVKVWEVPVRITHWTLALSVTVLGVTGYLIGDPQFSVPGEASASYSFGWIRYIHFVAAYVLLATVILRGYWGFVGNRWSRWSHMIPTSKQRLTAFFEEVKELIWPVGRFEAFMGHAPIAATFYVLVYLIALFAVATGFILYGAADYSPFWRAVTGPGTALFGSLNLVRLWHHWLTWVFAVFFVIHFYLVIYSTLFSRTTEVDTMISGYRFVQKDYLYPEDEDLYD